MGMILTNNRVVAKGEKPYIVAEVNSSHNGDAAIAKRMIDSAVEAGCSCVKFQSWSAESLYSRTYYDENPIAKRFIRKFSLSEEALLEVMKYCDEKGMDFSSTPYCDGEVDFLAAHKVPYIKISSMEINNFPFLEYIAKKQLPIILSTGMSDLAEVRRAVSVIENAGNRNICLLHCISIYPADPASINLNNIRMLQDEFPEYPIGFSDHSLGTELACAAVALGACVVEKHITLDKTRIGMDNQMAIEPNEMKTLVADCNNVWQAMGKYERVVSKAEYEQRMKMRRSLIYRKAFSKGTVISIGDLSCKRPGSGIAPDLIGNIVGRKLVCDVQADTLVTEGDFDENLDHRT